MMLELKGKRVLIAGFGYVGEGLGERLVRQGCHVWGLRRSSAPLQSPIEPIRADLARPETLERLPEVDYVIYSVGADSSEDGAYRAAYVEGPSNLMQALKELAIYPRRIFFTSSTGVYAQTSGEWVDENSPTEPTHFTGRRILEGEKRLLQGRIPATIVRFGGIYGPSRIGFFLALRRRPEISADDPARYLNLIHREDCIGVLAHLISLESPESVYLAADGNPFQRSEIKKWLLAHWPAEGVPSEKPLLAGRRRARSNKRCSNARLKASGYHFVYPSFVSGIENSTP